MTTKTLEINPGPARLGGLYCNSLQSSCPCCRRMNAHERALQLGVVFEEFSS
jgi:hypothetical protein